MAERLLVGERALGMVEFKLQGQSFLVCRDTLSRVDGAEGVSNQTVERSLADLSEHILNVCVLWREHVQVVLHRRVAGWSAEPRNLRLNPKQ